MSLSKQQIDRLLSLIASAQPDQGGCDSCFEHLAEFAELELQGRPIPEALLAIEVHLQQCPCCRLEYDALLAGLRALEEE
ncbi:MAG: hypothetical protein MI861_23560 [Pirellulales bacterium]|nr:hypothetical protein [Pirellulales bacterium]